MPWTPSASHCAEQPHSQLPPGCRSCRPTCTGGATMAAPHMCEHRLEKGSPSYLIQKPTWVQKLPPDLYSPSRLVFWSGCRSVAISRSNSPAPGGTRRGSATTEGRTWVSSHRGAGVGQQPQTGSLLVAIGVERGAGRQAPWCTHASNARFKCTHPVQTPTGRPHQPHHLHAVPGQHKPNRATAAGLHASDYCPGAG